MVFVMFETGKQQTLSEFVCTQIGLFMNGLLFGQLIGPVAMPTVRYNRTGNI